MGRITNQTVSAGASIGHRLIANPTAQRKLFNSLRLRRPETEALLVDPNLAFLAFVAAHRTQSHSQILQDLWVRFELGDLREGFFVEFGATDGKTNSNTWILENQFGWTGILAEPNPVWHSALHDNRNVAIDTRCVAAKSGETVRFIATDSTDPELSGIADFSAGRHFDSARESGRELDIETISLDDLLAQYEAPAHIDYLSIDTEGSELEILANFDLGARSISLMSVEHNEATAGPIDALLADHGLERVFPQYSQWDAWYVNRDLVASSAR
ncbi:FkbM family methyltransferase [Branchiibius sp. NY16-3462-2]|uniref:FkbM family methyltransferase n=1 Tax=Branchiibius sp. NY16-3462-2 TaxID=1807500 RepID=UPI000799A1C2|nr:FkbM family methyltransferase [Branchiibius sp. NY16-3462-2]KYH44966.1 methyltransferase [Branchiibius sp. NY16-3462-2]